MKLTYFFFIFLFLYNTYGFGISPGSFDIQLNNGEEIEKSFYIYNNKEETREFNISSYGINFFNFTDFNTKIKGNSEEEIKFLISIPTETEQDNYEGRIYVNELNKESGGINLDTLLGIKFNFNIKSNYTKSEESFEGKFETEENEEDKENRFLEYSGFAINLFYFLLILIIILCIYRMISRLLSK